MRNLDLIQIFPILWIELTLCIQQATTSVASGKIFPAKTNWSIHRKSLFFRPKSIHNLRFTCHATCPLAQEYYSPRGRTVSTSHIGKPVLAPVLRKQSDFALLRSPKGLEISLFHAISLSVTYTGAPMRNLGLA